MVLGEISSSDKKAADGCSWRQLRYDLDSPHSEDWNFSLAEDDGTVLTTIQITSDNRCAASNETQTTATEQTLLGNDEWMKMQLNTTAQQ